MNENEYIKIQNLYDFTDDSKEIDEFELLKEVTRLCFRVRVLGKKSTKVCYCKGEEKELTQSTVDELSMTHKSIIVIVMVIMGKEMKGVSRLFFRQTTQATYHLKDMQMEYEIPKSIREFREKYIDVYCK